MYVTMDSLLTINKKTFALIPKDRLYVTDTGVICCAESFGECLPSKALYPIGEYTSISICAYKDNLVRSHLKNIGYLEKPMHVLSPKEFELLNDKMSKESYEVRPFDK